MPFFHVIGSLNFKDCYSSSPKHSDSHFLSLICCFFFCLFGVFFISLIRLNEFEVNMPKIYLHKITVCKLRYPQTVGFNISHCIFLQQKRYKIQIQNTHTASKSSWHLNPETLSWTETIKLIDSKVKIPNFEVCYEWTLQMHFVYNNMITFMS